MTYPPFICDEQNRCVKCGSHPCIIFSEIDVYETTTCGKCAGLPEPKADGFDLETDIAKLKKAWRASGAVPRLDSIERRLPITDDERKQLDAVRAALGGKS